MHHAPLSYVSKTRGNWFMMHHEETKLGKGGPSLKVRTGRKSNVGDL